MNTRANGWILIALSAVSFGVMGVLVKLAHGEGVDTLSALSLRFLIASAVLIPLAAIRRKPLPRAKTLGTLFLFGSCGYVAHSICFFIALKHASAGLTSLLLYLYPALVALGCAAFFGERLGRDRLAALGVALAGLVLVVDMGPGNRLLGIALALACAFIYAAYILACSRVTRGVDPLTSATVIIAGAAVIYGGIALGLGSPLPPTSAGWSLVALIGIVSTAIAIGAFFAAMERIGPSAAATGSTLEPIVTVIAGAVVLDEQLTIIQIAGGALIVAAVVLLATRPPASSP
ncbi:MAG TPA: DMT family transporter [Planctomycetota bacterium]|nr:DMT family transporter [Planctomycetota bacterium]